jgi:flavin reductase (DIM6/NTAB) family NADH-FMN oxidoreductase RutF
MEINMKNFKEISPEALHKNPFHLIGKEWMLIAAGNEKKANAMTASWGGFGIMYGKNTAFIVVRPQRYTKEFIDNENALSLNFFDKEYKDTLNYYGSVSGRDEDKILKSGLTLNFSNGIPYFVEANHILLCKTLVKQPISENSLLDEKLNKIWYPNKDYHMLYITEITKALQTAKN